MHNLHGQTASLELEMDAQCTLSTAGHSVGRGICKSELLCEYLYFKFFYFGTSSGLHDALQPMSRGPFKIDRTAPAGPAPLRGRSGASVAPGPLSGGSRARAAGVVGSGTRPFSRPAGPGGDRAGHHRAGRSGALPSPPL